ITVLITQLMFGIDFLLITLFAMGSSDMFLMNEIIMARVSMIFVISGIFVFIATSIRFYYLLKNGEYRADSSKDLLRSKFEKKQLLVPAIIVGTSFVLIIQSVGKNIMTFDANIMTLLTIGPVLYFTMLFILPEQLILLYCKARFDSFNFDKEGNLIRLSNKENIEEI